MIGEPEVGRTLVAEATVSGDTRSVSYQWMRSGAPIADATEATYLLRPADDRMVVTVVVTTFGSSGSAVAASQPLVVAYAQPTAAGGLSDVRLTETDGIRSLAAAADFSVFGDPSLLGASFSLSDAPAGVSIDAATGVVTIDPARTGTLSVVSIVVRATNSGGWADSGFSLTIGAGAKAPLQPDAPELKGGAETLQAAIPALPDDGGSPITGGQFRVFAISDTTNPVAMLTLDPTDAGTSIDTTVTAAGEYVADLRWTNAVGDSDRSVLSDPATVDSVAYAPTVAYAGLAGDNQTDRNGERVNGDYTARWSNLLAGAPAGDYVFMIWVAEALTTSFSSSTLTLYEVAGGTAIATGTRHGVTSWNSEGNNRAAMCFTMSVPEGGGVLDMGSIPRTFRTVCDPIRMEPGTLSKVAAGFTTSSSGSLTLPFAPKYGVVYAMSFEGDGADDDVTLAGPAWSGSRISDRGSKGLVRTGWMTVGASGEVAIKTDGDRVFALAFESALVPRIAATTALAPDPAVGANVVAGAPDVYSAALTEPTAGSYRVEESGGEIKAAWDVSGAPLGSWLRFRVTLDTSEVAPGKWVTVKLGENAGHASEAHVVALTGPDPQTVEVYARKRTANFFATAAILGGKYYVNDASESAQDPVAVTGEAITFSDVSCAVVVDLAPDEVTNSNRVEFSGFRFDLDRERTIGRYVAGHRYWALNDQASSDPAAVTAAWPPSEAGSGGRIHGSMLNPGFLRGDFDGLFYQKGWTLKHTGWDWRGKDDAVIPYQSSLDLDPANRGDAFTFSPAVDGREGAIVKAMSQPAGHRYVTGKTNPVIQRFGILDVVATQPRPGDFAPPVAALSKASPANVADIDMSVFPALPLSGVSYDVETTIQRLEHWLNVANSSLHFAQNLVALESCESTYGRETGRMYSEALVLTCCDASIISADQKQRLVRALVQHAIEHRGRQAQGGQWGATGGNAPGRKALIAMAAACLTGESAAFVYADGGTMADGCTLPSHWDGISPWHLDQAIRRVQESELGILGFNTQEDRSIEPPRPWNVGQVVWRECFFDLRYTTFRTSASYRQIVLGNSIGGILALNLIKGARAAFANEDLFNFYDHNFDLFEWTNGDDVGADDWTPIVNAALRQWRYERTDVPPIGNHTYANEIVQTRYLPVDMVEGRSFSYDLRAAVFRWGGAPGGVATSYTITAGALPAGLALDDQTGVISGMVEATADTFHEISVVARNIHGESDPVRLHFWVQPAAGAEDLIAFHNTMPDHLDDPTHGLFSWTSSGRNARLIVNDLGGGLRSYSCQRLGNNNPTSDNGINNPSVSWMLTGLEIGATYSVTVTADRGSVPAMDALTLWAAEHWGGAGRTTLATAMDGAGLSGTFTLVATRSLMWVGVRAGTSSADATFTVTNLQVRRDPVR